MPPLVRVRLDQQAHAEVDQRYRTTRDAQTRYQMVLLSAQGHSAPQIATLTRRSADTVRRVLRRGQVVYGQHAADEMDGMGRSSHSTRSS